MSVTRSTMIGVLPALPLAAGALATVALAADERTVQLGIALPAIPLIAGLAVSCAVAVSLVLARRRHQSHERIAAHIRQARSEGAEHEKEQRRRFLARLDHELKNPVMAIRAQAAAAEQSREWLTVDAQATKLSALVQDLRKLSELETSPIEAEQIDLEELVRESVDAVEQQHPDAKGRFRISATRVPWPVPTITGDLDLLSLAIDNILGNAAKYSEAGTIEIALRERDGGAQLEVADCGRGIPQEDHELVFDELARATNARDIPGTGLGLTLVRTVIHRHGGNVELRSKVGQGTVLTLWVPQTSKP